MTRLYLTLLVGVLFVAGCSSSKKTTADDAPPYYLGVFEDFDDQAYEDVTPPIEPISTEHDIPAKLTTRAGVGSNLVRGFRIQLFSSLNRTEANAAMQRAIAWWENKHDTQAARPPIYMEYQQPYYKVRAGNFRTRAEASRFADQMGRKFAGAFIVPSLIETSR